MMNRQIHRKVPWKYQGFRFIPTVLLAFISLYMVAVPSYFQPANLSPSAPPTAVHRSRHRFPNERTKIESEFTLFLSAHSEAAFHKPYYRFRNVELTRQTLQVFYGDSLGQPPQQELKAALTHCNATVPDLPTLIVVEGSDSTVAKQEIDIVYTPAATAQPTCSKWIETPTYLMDVRHSKNIWHTIDEGLASVFQTMRELGHIQLAEIDQAGGVKIVEDGSDCALTWDYSAQKMVEYNCNANKKRTIPKSCTAKDDWWCRPGVYNIDRSEGPILLAYDSQTWNNKWSPLYKAMTSNIGAWKALEGGCFKELIIGRAHTIDFHELRRPTNLSEAYHRHRVASLAAFKRLMLTELRDIGHIIQSNLRDGVDIRNVDAKLLQRDSLTGVMFSGYCDPDLEKLRQGIGPEEINALSALRSPHGLFNLTKQPDIQRFHAILTAEPELVKAAVASLRKHTGLPVTYPSTRKHVVHNCKSAPSGKQVALLGLDDITCPCWKQAKGIAYEEKVKIARDWDRRVPYEKTDRTIHLERPRPVVTLIKRNFIYPFTSLHSRALLNGHDILAYILARYNVTAKVVTFEEPMMTAIQAVAHTDVLIGMHGAAWTNTMFIKPGAAVLQLYPYGWYSEELHGPIRGHTYKLVSEASNCKYNEWVNPRRDYAFFRPADWDFNNKTYTYSLNPEPEWPTPQNNSPEKYWIYQSTFVDMDEMAPILDKLMAQAGIQPMPFIVK